LSYFLRDKSGKKVAVFKPMENGDPASYKREIAAYWVDQPQVYNVPFTTAVSIEHKVFAGSLEGSLQAFADNDGSGWDISSSLFSTEDVHKIGILDLQIMNCDRHEGNILVKRRSDGMYSMVPIDHGNSLPENLSNSWFVWQNWRQSRMPFCESIRDHIRNIDLEANVRMLRQLQIEEKALFNFRICTTLLKKGESYGLTVGELGDIMCRRDLGTPSELEIIYEASKIPGLTFDDDRRFQLIEQEMDKHLKFKLPCHR